MIGITNKSHFKLILFQKTAKSGTDIIYDEENFESGEIAAGFLFDINDLK